MTDPRVVEPTRPHDPFDFYLPSDLPTPIPADQAQDYLRALVQLNTELAERFRREKIKIPVDLVASAQTDSSGNATFPIYQVGAGFYLSVARLVLEADGSTPASPFSGGWLRIVAGPNPKNAAQGQMVDFLPTTAGGQMFPAVAQYANGGDPADVNGVLVRSQEFLVCQITSGPVSKTITAHMTGALWGQES